MAKKESAKSEQTLFCCVGRGANQAIATSSDDAEGNARLDAVQNAKVADLLRSGVDLSRVVFSRESNKGE